MKDIKKDDTQEFYETMPATMSQPQAPMVDSRTAARGLLAWLLLPLAVIGGLALWSYKKRGKGGDMDKDSLE